MTGSDYTCTGTADNTVILTAYNALAAAGGGILFLRPGNYNIDAAMQLQYGNVSIVGSGQGVTTLTCRYDGSGGTQNSYYGMLAYWNSDNATPIHNVVIRDLSINLNGFSTNGIHFRATTSTAVASKKYLVENVDIYSRGSDATGSVGCIKITGSYGSVQGTFKRVTLRNVEIHDASVATSSINPTGFSVLILSNDLSVFKMDNCYFHDTYGSTISTVSQTAITRKDWTFSNCSFVNTIRIYNGSALADIEDSNANGFNGIKIVNCTFDAAASWSVTDDIYCLKIYDSTNFIVDHCVFNNPRAVIAVGLSPGTKESQSWTFSNNVIYNSLRFTDPDGHYAGTYSNNIFWKSQYTIFGGYGRHYPTLFHGNLLYNCGLNPQTDIIAHQSIISISDGGNIFQDNTFYSDIAAPNLLCVFAENSQGGSTAYHNVYKNNTFLGSQLPARIFGTDTGFKHTIMGNTGITESTINSSFR